MEHKNTGVAPQVKGHLEILLASLKLPSSVHEEVGKSATSVGLRAPAGRFDAAQGGSIDTGSGRRAVSSSPGRAVGGRSSQVRTYSPGNMEQAPSRGHEARPQSGLGAG